MFVPHIDKTQFPTVHEFHHGNMFKNGDLNQPTPEFAWTYNVVESLFDQAVTALGSAASGYYLYGHSAGSQFVHRTLLSLSHTRIIKAISANAGRYMFPCFSTPFPAGLYGTSITPETVRKAFATRLTLLLGELDNEQGPWLPMDKWTGAQAQGHDRFDRGHNFYTFAKNQAEECGWPFNWDIVTVPEVGHDNGGMAPAAVREFFMSNKDPLPPYSDGAGKRFKILP
jgi:hypothetical protein